VFVTDLGGGHAYSPSNYLPILRLVTGFLLISEYSRSLWQQARHANPKIQADQKARANILRASLKS